MEKGTKVRQRLGQTDQGLWLHRYGTVESQISSIFSQVRWEAYELDMKQISRVLSPHIEVAANDSLQTLEQYLDSTKHPWNFYRPDPK